MGRHHEKDTHGVPKNESRLIQMIKMGKSIRHKWVKSHNYVYRITIFQCNALLSPLNAKHNYQHNQNLRF